MLSLRRRSRGVSDVSEVGVVCYGQDNYLCYGQDNYLRGYNQHRVSTFDVTCVDHSMNDTKKNLPLRPFTLKIRQSFVVIEEKRPSFTTPPPSFYMSFLSPNPWSSRPKLRVKHSTTHGVGTRLEKAEVKG